MPGAALEPAAAGLPAAGSSLTCSSTSGTDISGRSPRRLKPRELCKRSHVFPQLERAEPRGLGERLLPALLPGQELPCDRAEGKAAELQPRCLGRDPCPEVGQGQLG